MWGYTLCVSFPSLFALVDPIKAWVKDVWFGTASGGRWSPCFTRSFTDWEMEEVEGFLLHLYGQKLIMEEDRVQCMETRDGIFSTKSLCKALASGSSVLFPMKNIWKSCVQPKVSFFTWEASWGKVLTLDQVKKRGWALANRCSFCQVEEESIDHLLLHCEKTSIVGDAFHPFWSVLGVPIIDLGNLIGLDWFLFG